ncbi:MAG: polysaccharide export protein [Gammaproteobacteria bacterium]|nr:polysaccharide export protein [Gammaproteobacteria bacterium]NNL52284.1 polysaccharide export protein [Woeseiaceae bacterium]
MANTGVAAPEEVPAYSLGVGDRVKVTVYGHPDLSGEFEVDSAGRISLPLIQHVQAAGLTLQEFEYAVAEKLKPDYLRNPRVNAEILNYRPFYIIGEVKEPGSYPYVNGMTVINAVAVAGGFTYRAKTKKLIIVRGDGEARERLKASPDTVVFPGDVIEVAERFF